MSVVSPYVNVLKNRIDLRQIPLSERGSRLLVFLENNHFSIQLAERWQKLSQRLSDYRDRPPIVDYLALGDENGNQIPLSVTTYPDHLDIQTPIGAFQMAFWDTETLILVLPSTRCKITLQARLDQAQNDRRGGVLHLTGKIRRNLAYTTNARLLENVIQSPEKGVQRIEMKIDASTGGKALLINITPRLGFNRWVPDAETALSTAAKRWDEWFSLPPKVLDSFQEQYTYAWWIMRAGLLSTRYYTTREVMTPSKAYYIGSWQWDNFFHALAYRHVDHKLAQEQLRILLDHQREDGMIPDAIHDEGTITHLDFPIEADVTKPPLIAWAALKLFEIDQDREFLDEIYGPLTKWNNWWFEKNDLNNNGLCEYQHPYSSGLDDSPLWDDGMPVESPDLNTYLFLQQESLAKIADEIGEADQAIQWRQKAEALVKRLIEYQWDESRGYFIATHNGRAIQTLTPISLFPLITGRMPRRISKKLLNHLFNPEEFWPRFPIPSVALNDHQYNPWQMWRGPTWANINYLIIDGLIRSGYLEQAKKLRDKTIELLASQKDFYEYYHPETGEKPPKAAPIFGWSAAIFIDLVIQATRESNGETKS